MEKTGIVIIGAGVVGLAIASRLSSMKKEIIVIEKHDGFGRETSSRNSEVIHAGIYYPSGTLKAELCVDGNRMLYELCREENIPFKKTGKIIFAGNKDEEEKIHGLLKQGTDNGVTGLRLITKSEIREMEPHILTDSGLFSLETGIIDTHSLMKYYEHKSLESGVIFAYNCEVKRIARENSNYTIEILDADGSMFSINSELVINSAGLSSDKVAYMAGIDIDKADYNIHPCKGEYFRVSNKHKGKISHLIYPAPTQISLGLHLVLGLDGSLKLGPNAFYIDEINYDINEDHKQDFFNCAKSYLDFIEIEDLQPDQAGIRPKLQSENEPFRDFVISEETDKGLSGLINLIGIESPGLTAAPAIAQYVEKLIK